MKRPWWMPKKKETIWDIARGYRKSAEEFQSLAHRALEVAQHLIEVLVDLQNQIETLKSLRRADEIRIRQLQEQLDGKEGTPCPSTSMSK